MPLLRSTAIVALGLVAALAACVEQPGDPAPAVGPCAVAIFFKPPTTPEVIAVVGTFTDWGARAVPMRDDDGDGVYMAIVEPSPGLHQYRIFVDGETSLDPYNPLTLFGEDGVENSALRMADCSAPRWAAEPDESTDSVRLRYVASRGGDGLDLGRVFASLDDGTRLPVSATEDGVAVAVGGLGRGKHWVAVEAADTAGRATPPLRVPRWVEPTRFQWHDATIYQVFIDRFRAGEGPLRDDVSISFYRGGDLGGVLEAIEDGYFQALGVNALWLSPVYENPEGAVMGRNGFVSEAYHGYWPTDPFAVETRFGGAEALRAVVEAAHARGMRVLLDIVMNHVHDTHPYWSERPADPAWFNHPDAACICGQSCPWSGFIRECWFDPFLPDLRLENPAVVERVVEDAAWWVEAFDVDGLRIDAVPMMPRLAVRHLRERLAERYQVGGEHIYLVGETYSFVGDQPLLRWYLGPHTLSGQFDFPVMWALREALAGRAGIDLLDREARAGQAAWAGSGAVMAPFLGNHDVPRFITDLHGDPLWSPATAPAPVPATDLPFEQLKLAWTFVLSQPGAPVIYYGDEIGLEGANDPDNRRNMRFGDALAPRQAAVLAHVQRLGKARACSTALRRGDLRTLALGADTYAWGRDAGDGYPAIGAFNRGATERTLSFTRPSPWSLAPDLAWRDVVSDRPLQRSGDTISFTLGPRESALFVHAPCADATYSTR
jgi:glycosidase